MAAILHAKHYGIDAPELNAKLLSFEHCAILQSLPSLTALQKQKLQAFVGVVYAADNFFDSERRSLFGARGVLDSETGTKYTRFAWCAREGTDVEKACRQIWKNGWYKGEVVTRAELPGRWKDVLACVTIFSGGKRHLRKSRLGF